MHLTQNQKVPTWMTNRQTTIITEYRREAQEAEKRNQALQNNIKRLDTSIHVMFTINDQGK